MEALKFIPDIEAPLLTEKGEAKLQKTDIFRKIMWFAFKDENNWYALDVDRVNEILEMNRQGKKPATLVLNEEQVKIPVATLNSDLETMDKKYQNRGKSKNKNQNRNRRDNKGNRNPNQGNPNQRNPNQPNANKQGPNKPNPNRPNPNRPNPNRPNPNKPNPNTPKG
jgi:hypothetical protein